MWLFSSVLFKLMVMSLKNNYLQYNVYSFTFHAFTIILENYIHDVYNK